MEEERGEQIRNHEIQWGVIGKFCELGNKSNFQTFLLNLLYYRAVNANSFLIHAHF
jgi:hypothetical protein